MYRISYTQGNGYRCSCCRNTYDETVDLQSPEMVIAWLSALEAAVRVPDKSDDDDRRVDKIEQLDPTDVTDQFRFDPGLVEKLVQGRIDAKNEKMREDKKVAEDAERRRYEELRKKFEVVGGEPQ